MNDDLTAVRGFGELLDIENAGLQAATRNRVLAVTNAEGTVVTGDGRRPAGSLWLRRPGRRIAGPGLRRPGVRLFLPVGAAVLVVFMAVSVIGLLRPTGHLGVPGGSGDGSVRIAPSPAPDPSAFIYTRSHLSQWSDPWVQTASGKTLKQIPRLSFAVRETWMSVDGSRDGGEGSGGKPSKDFPGCRNGRQRVGLAGSRTAPCLSTRGAYQPDFPTTQAGIRARLSKGYTLQDDGEGVFDAIAETMMEQELPPAARAAMFDLALHTSHVVRVPGESTLEGVTGVLLIQAWPDKTQQELLFDAETNELLGRAVIPRLPSGASGNPLSSGSWVQVTDERGIVDRFGVRPDGTVADAAHRIVARRWSGS